MKTSLISAAVGHKPKPRLFAAIIRLLSVVGAPFFLAILYSSPAYAYLGPGLGSGAVAATLGIVAGLLMLVVGVVWYPLKRLIQKLKGQGAEQSSDGSPGA